MSTIDSIISAIQSKIATALPAYAKLSNPYNTADNDEVFLRQGYGVTIGASSKNRVTTSVIGMQRKFGIVLTAEVFSTKNDDSTKENAHLALANDQLSVIKAIELDFSLGGAVLKAEYESDEGIQFVNNKNEKFLELKTIVSVSYTEAVT